LGFDVGCLAGLDVGCLAGLNAGLMLGCNWVDDGLGMGWIIITLVWVESGLQKLAFRMDDVGFWVKDHPLAGLLVSTQSVVMVLMN
jgi:hypothetical protein